MTLTRRLKRHPIPARRPEANARALTVLGHKTIAATIVTLDKLRAELAEIDENLIRNELTVLERGEHLSRRKQIHESLHPQAKQGGDRKSEAAKSNENNFPLIDAFASDAAKATGATARSTDVQAT